MISVPPDLESLTPADVPGLTPVILNMVPLTDLPLFLGVSSLDGPADDGAEPPVQLGQLSKARLED